MASPQTPNGWVLFPVAPFSGIEFPRDLEFGDVAPVDLIERRVLHSARIAAYRLPFLPHQNRQTGGRKKIRSILMIRSHSYEIRRS